MNCEFKHYSIKGMKWGVRRKRDVDAKNKRKNSSLDMEHMIKNGAAKTKQFLSDNGPMLAKSATILALSSIGGIYLGTAASNILNLDMSAFGIGTSTTHDMRVTLKPIQSVKAPWE